MESGKPSPEGLPSSAFHAKEDSENIAKDSKRHIMAQVSGNIGPMGRDKTQARVGKVCALAVLGLTIALAGCGRRSSLDAPNAPSAPVAAAPVAPTASVAPVQEQTATGSQVLNPPPEKQPSHDSFFLDFLI